MDKILFILNPIAGGGKAKDLEPIIREKMKSRSEEYKLVVTEKPNDATFFAEKGVEEGYKLIVSVGGDGTLNEIAKAILDTDVSLGMLPGGTGNDMARTLDISLDPNEALDNIFNHEKKTIDVGYVNDELFLNIASTGLDSEVVERAKKYKEKYKGNTAYSISVFETLFKFRKKPMKIIIDGEELDEEIYLVAVGNGKTYGGGFKILPMAKLDDGYFHVCVVKGMFKPLLFVLFPSILFGKHTIFKKYVYIYKAKDVSIRTNSELYLNVDGEISKLPEETNFELSSGRLNIVY